MKQDRLGSLNPLSSIRIYSNLSASTSIKIIIYQHLDNSKMSFMSYEF